MCGQNWNSDAEATQTKEKMTEYLTMPDTNASKALRPPKGPQCHAWLPCCQGVLICLLQNLLQPSPPAPTCDASCMSTARPPAPISNCGKGCGFDPRSRGDRSRTHKTCNTQTNGPIHACTPFTFTLFPWATDSKHMT